MMHTLLVYLQTALQEQLPIIGGLLLQLDLLVNLSMSSFPSFIFLIDCC